METETLRQNIECYFAALEERLDELISICERLTQENRSLHAQQAALVAERDQLIQEHEQSRARIDAMVARLKGLEQTS